MRHTPVVRLSDRVLRIYLLASDHAPGQGLTEYALILSFLSLFAIVGLFLFGQSFASLLGNTSGGVASCVNSPSGCVTPGP